MKAEAFMAFADAIENLGGPGVDGGAIAGLYIAAKIARFDGENYRVTDSAFWNRDRLLRAQAVVAEIDARAECGR